MTKSSKRQQHNKQEKQTKAKLEKLCQIPKMSSSRVNPRNFNRKMKKESLRSEEGSLEAFLPRSPTHMRGCWRICVHYHDQTTPRHPLIKPRCGLSP
ncbi:hypothetical protein PIB30_073127 [Stylosanthes scabra]|uniref:Uncharacterized protein n=1 Tax=Stylosanthes scabra TaxID=79078 RepID=A0ABU6SPD7_9FABA|nr:hypothetical protein [Stylosanthes scabra]